MPLQTVRCVYDFFYVWFVQLFYSDTFSCLWYFFTCWSLFVFFFLSFFLQGLFFDEAYGFYPGQVLIGPAKVFSNVQWLSGVKPVLSRKCKFRVVVEEVRWCFPFHSQRKYLDFSSRTFVSFLSCKDENSWTLSSHHSVIYSDWSVYCDSCDTCQYERLSILLLCRWRWLSWRWRGSPGASLQKVPTAFIHLPPPSHRKTSAGLNPDTHIMLIFIWIISSSCDLCCVKNKTCFKIAVQVSEGRQFSLLKVYFYRFVLIQSETSGLLRPHPEAAGREGALCLPGKRWCHADHLWWTWGRSGPARRPCGQKGLNEVF